MMTIKIDDIDGDYTIKEAAELCFGSPGEIYHLEELNGTTRVVISQKYQGLAESVASITPELAPFMLINQL